MRVAPNARRLLRIAGVVLWLSSGVPAVILLAHMQHVLGVQGSAMWLGAFAIFGVAFWLATASLNQEKRGGDTTLLLAVQTIAALTMFHVLCTGFESALLVLVAAGLGLLLPLGIAIPWMVAQTLLFGWIGTYHWPMTMVIWWTGGAFGMQVFGLLIASFAASETQARQALGRANAELRATRVLLTQSSRAAERVRISRDLHDLMGHHLTALSLHLEVARHVAGQTAREPIAKAQLATKELLQDVRHVVSALREEPIVDIRQALHTLVTGIDAPQIHIDCPPGLEIPDPELAHTLVRCAQEVVTNTIRHADADNLWIEVSHKDDRFELDAFDDGRGAADLQPGNGLTGLRERIEEVHGRVYYGSKSGRGFWINVSIPHELVRAS